MKTMFGFPETVAMTVLTFKNMLRVTSNNNIRMLGSTCQNYKSKV
jgi:hypothetical protein